MCLRMGAHRDLLYGLSYCGGHGNRPFCSLKSRASSFVMTTKARPRLSSTCNTLSRRTELVPFSKRDMRSADTPAKDAASSMRILSVFRVCRTTAPRVLVSLTMFMTRFCFGIAATIAIVCSKERRFQLFRNSFVK